MARGNPWDRVVSAGIRRLRVWPELAWARRLSRSRLLRTRPTRLLVVCYGNIYRSPFAAALLAGGGASMSFEVRSAGFHHRSGRETPPAFREVARDYGVSLDQHRSSRIDRATVDWAETIVIMDRHNWDDLRVLGLTAQPKVVWLGAFLDEGSVEILDPYGRELEEMRAIADRLYRATNALGAFLGRVPRVARSG